MIAWLAREVGATFPEANRLSRNKTTHLIVGRIAAIGGSTSPAPWEEVSVKEKTAQEWGTACVSETWLELCAARGRLLGDYEAPALSSPPSLPTVTHTHTITPSLSGGISGGEQSKENERRGEVEERREEERRGGGKRGGLERRRGGEVR